jgi:peptidoglycan/LPS O-acetylase OafA/YrhL
VLVRSTSCRCHDRAVSQPSGTPTLPRSIWVVAWASLVAQLVQLVHREPGFDNEVSLVVSVVLGGLLVGWVSAGVVRARTGRVVVAWVVLVLSGIAEVVAVFSTDDSTPLLPALVALATTVVSLVGLAMFRGTEWWRWQRTRPPRDEGASIAGLVAVAVLVGVLGGVMGVNEDSFNLTVNLGF